MKTSLPRGMLAVTTLTKSGKLAEATALIQSLLTGGEAVPATDAPRPQIAGDTIDGAFTRLGETARAPASAANIAAVPAAAPAPKVAAKTRLRDAPRAALGETLRKISAGGMPRAAKVATPRTDLPAGASFVTLTHGTGAARRDYRLYVPAHRPDAAMPLIVMLHGCTQSPEDFATGTGMNALAEEFGCLIAYPGQPSGANAQKCWNWFRPDDQARDRGEPALIAGLTRDILRDYPADPARVYIAGLSAGAAAAVIVAAAYPEIYSAVGAHSGLPVGAASDVASAFSAMRGGASGRALKAAVPTIAFHGLADGTVHPDNSAAITARAIAGQGALRKSERTVSAPGRRAARQIRHDHADGRSMAEHWQIDGAGHAWSGGQARGSYTDPAGPDASREMLRFFLQHRSD